MALLLCGDGDLHGRACVSCDALGYHSTVINFMIATAARAGARVIEFAGIHCPALLSRSAVAARGSLVAVEENNYLTERLTSRGRCGLCIFDFFPE